MCTKCTKCVRNVYEMCTFFLPRTDHCDHRRLQSHSQCTKMQACTQAVQNLPLEQVSEALPKIGAQDIWRRVQQMLV